jgi:hypothetical protein
MMVKWLFETLESAPIHFVISTYAGDGTPALVLVEVGSDDVPATDFNFTSFHLCLLPEVVEFVMDLGVELEDNITDILAINSDDHPVVPMNL